MSETLNIAIISREFPKETYYGGIAEYSWQLACELSKRHEVTVISTSKDGLKTYLENKFKVYRLLESGDDYTSFLKHSKTVFDFIKTANKYDIIESPDFKAEGFFLKGHPLITRFHSPLFLINRYLPENRWGTDILQESIEYLQAKNSLGLTAPTLSIKKDIVREWNLKKIKVIPNGLSVKFSEDLVDIANQNNCKIVYIGRIEYRKGVLDLAIAAKKLSKQFKFELIYIGKDTKYNGVSLSDEIKRVYKSAKIRKFLDISEVYKYIKSATVIVIPAHWDNMPYVCLQAMALGTPLVVSDAGGLPEMIINKKTGLVFKSKNILELTSTLKFALENPLELEKYVKNAKMYFKNNFAIEKTAWQTEKYYKEMLL